MPMKPDPDEEKQERRTVPAAAEPPADEPADPPHADEPADPPPSEAADEPAPEDVDAPADNAPADPEPADEPAPSVPVARRTPAAPEPDELDKEFDEVLAAIDQDEELSPSRKLVEKLRVKTEREARQVRRSLEAENAENRARDAAAADLGVSRKVFDTTWAAAVAECNRELGGFDPGAAQILLRQKVAQLKAKAKTQQAAAGRAPATPAVKRDGAGKFAGAQIAPPVAARGGARKLSADEKLEREMKRIYGG